jgi:hypothetical protein
LLEIFEIISVPSGLSHYIFVESILQKARDTKMLAGNNFSYSLNWRKSFIKADYIFSRIKMENEQLKFNSTLNECFKR